MTTLASRTTPATTPRLDLPASLFLVVGGIAFFASGPLHPQGSDEGDRTEQLHSMLVDSAWYPAHLVGLLGLSCVAAGLIALGRNPDLRDRLGRLLTVSIVVAVISVLGAVIHLFAATQADEIEDGSTTPLVAAFMGVETVVNPAWGLMIAALAIVGGLTRRLGNRVVLGLGVLGGLAFAVATVTIAFVDTFDALFSVAGLVGIWLVAVGVIGLTRSTAVTTPDPPSPSTRLMHVHQPGHQVDTDSKAAAPRVGPNKDGSGSDHCGHARRGGDRAARPDMKEKSAWSVLRDS